MRAQTGCKRKRQRTKQPTEFEKERQDIFREVAELKRQKLTTDIEKNKLKLEVYKAKLEILKDYKNKEI